MALNYGLKEIEEKKAIDVAFPIYSSLFFQVLNISDPYYKITSIDEFTRLINLANFTNIDANLTTPELFVQSLNYDYAYPSDKTNLRTIDYYFNFIIDTLHYNYNLILINCSSNENNFAAAIQNYSIDFCFYDPLKTTISQTIEDQIVKNKIPIILNASISNSTFVSPEKKFYIDKNITNFNLDFTDFYSRSELNNDDFKQMACSIAGIKRIKRYYGDENISDDSEYSNSPYILISLVSDAVGIISRQYATPWFSAAGSSKGIILNQKFTKINLDKIKYSESIIPVSPTDLSFETGSSLSTISDRRINVFLQLNTATGKEYCLGTYYSGITSPTNVALESFAVSYLISEIKKLIDPVLLKYTFSLNNKSVRDFIKAESDLIFRKLISSRAISKYSIICDETNNTPEIINNRKLILDISFTPVQSTKSINLIFNT